MLVLISVHLFMFPIKITRIFTLKGQTYCFGRMLNDSYNYLITLECNFVVWREESLVNVSSLHTLPDLFKNTTNS